MIVRAQGACFPSAEKETFSIWLVSTASRKVEYAHGVDFASAATAACDETAAAAAANAPSFARLPALMCSAAGRCGAAARMAGPRGARSKPATTASEPQSAVSFIIFNASFARRRLVGARQA